MNQRILLRTTAFIGAACLLVACTAEQEGTADSVTETNGPAGAVPDGLADFYAQSLTWESCPPYASTDFGDQLFGLPELQCARVDVPLDYAEPDGEVISIGLLRKRATGDGERIGSLLINPGGPGVSGMESAAALTMSSAMEELGESFDIVGFDPRGVGASEPVVRCLSDTERDERRADDSDADGSRESVRRHEAEMREFAENCVQRTEHGERMLANLGTRDVVRDMDVVRSVLGDEKLTYVGYSYGTRIGYSYADTFGANVRALLLDGALDPEQDLVESLVAQGEGFGQAFEEFSAWCSRRDDCALGTDPDQATAQFQDLVRPLIDDNVDLADGRELSYDDATTAAVQALYSEQLWESLNSGLNELRRQRGEQLMQLADMYNERDPDGTYSTTQDAFVAIRCVDDPRVTDREVIREAQQRYAEAAPFLDPGRPPSTARDACAFWPVDNTSEPRLSDLDGVPPSLIISTTNDPATPYQAGVQLAKAMDGRLLTFEGNQHTVFAQGNDCVDEHGIAYLLEGTLPPEGERCARS